MAKKYMIRDIMIERQSILGGALFMKKYSMLHIEKELE